MPENTAFAGLHAVVAEDSQHMRTLLRSMLRTLGFAQVDVETNGADVLRVIETGTPDIVLLDWNMPGLSGIDVVRAIRRFPEPLARVPVMMVTAHASPQRLALSHSLGVNDFLCKPISIKVLARRLQKIVEDPYQVLKPESAQAPQRQRKMPLDVLAQDMAAPVKPNKTKKQKTDVEAFYV